MGDETGPAAYFERVGPSRFRATDLVGGAWDPAEQHVAPVMGLLTHLVETDHAARGGDLRLVRLSFDVLGTLPVDVMDVEVDVLRPGRTVELVQVRLDHAGRPAILLRAWLARSYDARAVAGTPLAPIAPPDAMEPWDPGTTWPGRFVRSVQARRTLAGPGRSTCWLRTDVPLLAGEDVSATARALGLVDLANGVAVRAAPRDVAFPNLDLTAHLFDAPRGRVARAGHQRVLRAGRSRPDPQHPPRRPRADRHRRAVPDRAAPGALRPPAAVLRVTDRRARGAARRAPA